MMSPMIHTITSALAHVSCDANLLVRNVQACAEEHTYRSVFVIDGTHPYLYENPAIANHVSGTTFIDMGRQLLKAISHLYYGTPIDSRFVLHNIDIEFLRWAKLGVEIEITVTVDMAQARRADAPRTCAATLVWRQEGHLVARARSRFTTFSAALEAKLMSRQYGQAPVNGELEPANQLPAFRTSPPGPLSNSAASPLCGEGEMMQ
jgi:hypothetical protein